MIINVSGISKSFQEKNIFKNITTEYSAGNIYGISGRNGSGKSTFLKIIAGYITPNEGNIIYTHLQKVHSSESIYQHVTFAAPYIELYDGATLSETLDFHFKLKNPIDGYSTQYLVDLLGFDGKMILQSFSSGMLQRVKLCLAIFSQSSILLIDEPTETLDKQGQQWFLELIKKHSNDRIVIIASNKESDFVHCNQILSVENYK